MRRGPTLVMLGFASALAGGAVACGLDLVGVAADNVTPDEAGPPAPEASIESDAGEGGLAIIESDGGEGVDIDLDAGVQGCNVVPVNDPLATVDGTRWIAAFNGAAGPPAPVTLQGGTKATRLIDGIDGARSALWLASMVPMLSFDVSFNFGIICTTEFFNYECADGLSAAWISSTTPDVLNAAGGGSTFAIPAGVKGGAVAVDIHSANGTSEDAPFLKMLGLDGLEAPGNDGLIVAKAARMDNLVGFVRRMRIRYKNGLATVFLENNQVMEMAIPKVEGPGLFGLTAATGGEHARFYVWNFAAVFRDCDLQ